ncbi:MAG: AI-2E family transporter [Thermotogae bacterium]|uniref:AI-2E family transporter n=1 Tax=Thermococcus litoralis TaxID=2265 RepID=A0A7C5JXN3_THELI|nr:AI-2E family transporter [Thermococcus sp.]RKX46528.1 MAG: AI-2E family transporter [Thermotogota bacterium]HHI01414.1 AI-2E family transporter [Thermococcus litoralis]
MKTEHAVWIAVSLIILFIVWKTVEPLITPIIFALTVAYIFHPLHERLAKRLDTNKSAMLLSALMTLLLIGFIFGIVLWFRDVTRALVIYINEALSWFLSLNLPPDIGQSAAILIERVSEKMSEYILNYTLSIPKLLLQAIVFIAVFYGILVHSRALSEELYALLPEERKDLGIELIEKAKYTLNAILRTWLMLSIFKGFLLTLGFYVFGVANLSGAIAAGIFCVILELLPVIGGWIVWIAGAIYLFTQGSIFAGIMLSVYGAILISPGPDITIRPKLIAKGAKINPALALVGIFGGIMGFGIKGLIIGPVALGLLSTLLEEWKEQKSRD